MAVVSVPVSVLIPSGHGYAPPAHNAHDGPLRDSKHKEDGGGSVPGVIAVAGLTRSAVEHSTSVSVTPTSTTRVPVQS